MRRERQAWEYIVQTPEKLIPIPSDESMKLMAWGGDRSIDCSSDRDLKVHGNLCHSRLLYCIVYWACALECGLYIEHLCTNF